MAGRIIIRLAHPPADDVAWLICDGNKILEGPYHTPFSELKNKVAQAEYPVIVLVPGIALQIFQTKIPQTSRSNLLKAIPYALEEQIADDVRNIHFAILELAADKQIIAVVARSLMDTWLKQLNEAEIITEQLIPDIYALPEAGTAWFALCDKDHMLCSCGTALKFATDNRNFYAVTRLFLESEQYPKPSHLEISCDDITSLHLPNGAVSINGVPIHYSPSRGSLLSYLAQHLPKSPTINLLQGDYQATHSQSQIKRTWLFAAAATALWFVSFMSHDVLQYYQLNKQHTHIKQQIEQIYRQVFPTATSITSPKVRFETELTSLQVASEGSLVLSLLSQAAPVIKRSKEISIENLDYKDEKLTIKVRANNFQNIESLVTALKQKNLSIEQSDAQRSENVATSNITIRKP